MLHLLTFEMPIYIIIIMLRIIIEYNKGNLSVFATLKSNSCLITLKDADPLGSAFEMLKGVKANLLSRLLNIKKYRREAAIYAESKVDSRFDFAGIDCNDIPFIMEVKNVPLADYDDISSSDRKKMIKNCIDIHINNKISYFPDVYRKKKGAVVSERALKHINELAEITYSKLIRPIICFVIQRTDVSSFQASVLDPTYKSAFNEAIKKGVEILVIVVSWNEQGEASFIRCDLPVNI